MCTGIHWIFRCGSCGTITLKDTCSVEGFTCREARRGRGRGDCKNGVAISKYDKVDESPCAQCEVESEIAAVDASTIEEGLDVDVDVEAAFEAAFEAGDNDDDDEDGDDYESEDEEEGGALLLDGDSDEEDEDGDEDEEKEKKKNKVRRVKVYVGGWSTIW
ncbi:hypothetical protein F4778DRAFT_788415 [Xylariomycetidae sp. FL2044]|nr:hypothetical protein F4778DRAFT_788415 [Xylariomycetidae sp. FL2044]